SAANESVRETADRPDHESSAEGRRSSMTPLSRWTCTIALLWIVGSMTPLAAEEPGIGLAGYRAACGGTLPRDGDELALAWPMNGNESGQLVLDLRPGRPLIRSMGIVPKSGERLRPIFSDVDPVAFLVVGTRQAPGYRPPEMSIFNV